MKNAPHRLALLLILVAAVMFGVAYASVPFYRWFCQVTGWGGTPKIITESEAKADKQKAENEDAAADGAITVRFDATVNPDLPWRFEPLQQSVTVQPGVETKILYRIHNNGAKHLTGSATFNVLPVQAGPYFHKLSCFCFTKKGLAPGATQDLPVVFTIDPEIRKDPDLQGLKTITLSYTYFNAHHH